MRRGTGWRRGDVPWGALRGWEVALARPLERAQRRPPRREAPPPKRPRPGPCGARPPPEGRPPCAGAGCPAPASRWPTTCSGGRCSQRGERSQPRGVARAAAAFRPAPAGRAGGPPLPRRGRVRPGPCRAPRADLRAGEADQIRLAETRRRCAFEDGGRARPHRGGALGAAFSGALPFLRLRGAGRWPRRVLHPVPNSHQGDPDPAHGQHAKVAVGEKPPGGGVKT